MSHACAALREREGSEQRYAASPAAPGEKDAATSFFLLSLFPFSFSPCGEAAERQSFAAARMKVK